MLLIILPSCLVTKLSQLWSSDRNKTPNRKPPFKLTQNCFLSSFAHDPHLRQSFPTHPMALFYEPRSRCSGIPSPFLGAVWCRVKHCLFLLDVLPIMKGHCCGQNMPECVTSFSFPANGSKPTQRAIVRHAL